METKTKCQVGTMQLHSPYKYTILSLICLCEHFLLALENLKITELLVQMSNKFGHFAQPQTISLPSHLCIEEGRRTLKTFDISYSDSPFLKFPYNLCCGNSPFIMLTCFALLLCFVTPLHGHILAYFVCLPSFEKNLYILVCVIIWIVLVVSYARVT